MSLIKVKRGSSESLPTLGLAELGYTTDSKKLYIGNGISNTLINKWNPVSVVNVDSSVGVWDRLIVDTSQGTLSITLPESPSFADEIEFIPGSNWDLTNFTVLRNGNLIAGVADDLLINSSQSFRMIYYNTNWGWCIV